MLLLYFDGGQSSDVFAKAPDPIKRPKLPKGYRYIDERPEKEKPLETRPPTPDPIKKKQLKPVSLADVQTLAKVFKGDLYPVSLFRVVDALELGQAPEIDLLQAARLETELYQKVAEAEREKDLLLALHDWLIQQVKGLSWSDEEILTVLLLVKKKRGANT